MKDLSGFVQFLSLHDVDDNKGSNSLLFLRKGEHEEQERGQDFYL